MNGTYVKGYFIQQHAGGSPPSAINAAIKDSVLDPFGEELKALEKY